MAEKAWKRAERRVAAYINSAWGGDSKRIPITGRQRGATPDVSGDEYGLSIEVKYRKGIPDWLRDAMIECCAYGDSRGLEPVVILIEAGKPIGDALVVRRLRDFCRGEDDG